MQRLSYERGVSAARERGRKLTQGLCSCARAVHAPQSDRRRELEQKSRRKVERKVKTQGCDGAPWSPCRGSRVLREQVGRLDQRVQWQDQEGAGVRSEGAPQAARHPHGRGQKAQT